MSLWADLGEDSCIVDRCVHNGTCVDGVGADYSCTCPPQFTGSRCEEGM